MTPIKSKNIQLKTGDKAFRVLMEQAHSDGRHVGEGDILEHWAAICADCHWRWYYDVKNAGMFPKT